MLSGRKQYVAGAQNHLSKVAAGGPAVDADIFRLPAEWCAGTGRRGAGARRRRGRGGDGGTRVGPQAVSSYTGGPQSTVAPGFPRVPRLPAVPRSRYDPAVWRATTQLTQPVLQALSSSGGRAPTFSTRPTPGAFCRATRDTSSDRAAGPPRTARCPGGPASVKTFAFKAFSH